MSSKVLAGRYELLEKIGDGGMAVVYRAMDKLLSRYVAVKILKPQFTGDEKFIENFRKESHADLHAAPPGSPSAKIQINYVSGRLNVRA